MKKERTFWIYLGSYGIILIVPMLLLLFVVFELYVRQYQDNIMENYEKDLKRAVSFFDASVSRLKSDTVQISGMKAFFSKYLAENYSSMYDVADALKRIIFSDDFVYNSFYYDRTLEKIYATDAVYSVEGFFQYGLGNQELDEKLILEKMSSGSSYVWLPEMSVNSTGEEEMVLTFLAPVIRLSGACDSVMIYQIPRQRIEELFGDTYQEKACYLLDEAGQIVWEMGGNPAAETFLEEEVGQVQKWKDAQKVTLDGKKVWLLMRYSETMRLTCVSIVPIGSLMAPVYRTLFLLFFGTMAILGLGSVIISMCMHRIYMPVQRLGQLAREIHPVQAAGKNEIDFASQTLTHLASIQEAEAERNRELLREKWLFRLLIGEFETIQEFNEIQDELIFQLEGESFLILAVYLEEEDTEGAEMSVCGQIDLNDVEQGFVIYPLELPQEHLELFLISGPKEHSESWNYQMKYLAQQLQEKQEVSCFGVGNRYDSLAEIGKSYLEAKDAVASAKTLFLPVCYYDQVERRQYAFPQEMILSMHDALKFADSIRIRFLYDSLCLSMQMKGNVLYAVCLFGWFLHMPSPDSMEQMIFPESLVSKYMKLLLNLSSVTLESVIDLIEEMAVEIIEGLNGDGREKTDQILESILSYIHENYAAPDFCASAVAEQFGMSVSNLSHYFKKHSGETISAYVSELKFGKAKELLRTTQLPVTEIAELCGNMQISSFLRKFKQMEGMTPTEYRRLHQEEKARRG